MNFRAHLPTNNHSADKDVDFDLVNNYCQHLTVGRIKPDLADDVLLLLELLFVFFQELLVLLLDHQLLEGLGLATLLLGQRG